MELTVESLTRELGLELVSGAERGRTHVRWVHATELVDPTPWLKGGELLLSTGMQLRDAASQRELIERLAAKDIAGLGFGTGFAHKRLPATLLKAARKYDFPLFEVPYALPFIAITERAFAQLLDERYEMLQRNMAGDVLAEALAGNLYPEDVQARLRPFGIQSRLAVLAFGTADPSSAAAALERALARERVPCLVALRGAVLYAVVDAGEHDAHGALNPVELAGKLRAELSTSFGAVRAAASRVCPTQALRTCYHEARCALEAVRLRAGDSPEVASFENLGAFQLLLSLQDDEALSSYCRSVLAPLEDGEGDYGEELVRSLDTFIEHNGHWEKAAGALFCHRHTLRYRIRRIEELTGRDFSNARDRIEFWLALRGRELVR